MKVTVASETCDAVSAVFGKSATEFVQYGDKNTSRSLVLVLITVVCTVSPVGLKLVSFFFGLTRMKMMTLTKKLCSDWGMMMALTPATCRPLARGVYSLTFKYVVHSQNNLLVLRGKKVWKLLNG